MKFKLFFGLIILFVCSSCWNKAAKGDDNATETTYTNPIWDKASDFTGVYYKGKYYFTQSAANKIVLWETADMTDLKNAIRKEVWVPTDPHNSFNLWAPELHCINNKWYIYFAADDGNTDNHQLYVIENSSSDPLQGKFAMKGMIMTNPEWNWAIHASSFIHKGAQYLIWSGWPKRRINTETQCIYIAKMKNPWTLESSRILISRPTYEWERQWVNPDGGRTAYPIHVNEAPQAFHSKNGDKILVYYSASGCWTPYYCQGVVVANADSNLLDSASWMKKTEPAFSASSENKIYGPGSISFLQSPDGKEYYFLYHARNAPTGNVHRTLHLQKIDWDVDGMPVLGNPTCEGVSLPKPSGTLPR